MIVFVAGMPRAGSMWTYNVAREVLASGKFNVLPKQIPSNEASLISEALASEVKEKEVYCIKTHAKLPNPIPTRHRVKIICNIRDVRDAALSYMRFIHGDFNQGVVALKAMMEVTDYYVKTFEHSLLSLRYEDITNTPSGLIDRLCDYLDVSLSDARKKEISEKFSKENVKKKLMEISEVKLDDKGMVKGAKHQARYESVRNLDGTYRAYDKNTAFQSNHITAKKNGEWRSVFNPSQVEQLNALCRTRLTKYEYPL